MFHSTPLETVLSWPRWLWCAVLLAPSLVMGQSPPTIDFVGTVFGSLPVVSPGALAVMSIGPNFGVSIGTGVTVNGVSCSILQVSPDNGEVVFRIPSETRLGTASVVLINNGLSSLPFQVPISAYTPRIEPLPFPDGGFAYAFHADGTRVTTAAPTAPGEKVTIYVNGLGAVDPPPLPSLSAGGFQANVESVSPNGNVEFFNGKHFGVPGIYGLTFAVPPRLPSGSYGLLLNIGGATSDETPFNGLIHPPQIPVVATGLILSESGETFRAVAGSTTTQQRTIAVIAASQLISWTTISATISGGNWLQASPANGISDPKQAPPLLTISASAANLSPGDYYGTVTIKPVDTNSSQIISVVLSVLPAAQSPGATVEPTGLLFTGSPGGTVPAAQNVQISNPTTVALTFTTIPTFSGPSSWFKFQPVTGTVPPGQPLSISVQPVAGLAAGVYTGSLSFGFSDGKTRVVNLQLVVAAGASTSGTALSSENAPAPAAAACTPTKLLPVLTLLGVNFTSPVAWPTPIEASIVDDCGTPLATGTAVTSFSNGDVQLALSPLQNGHWTATWVPVHPVTSALTATLNAQGFTPALLGTTQVSGTTPPNPKVPIISSGGVVGTASYVASPSPGAFVSVFGTALADSVTSATQLPLPTLLATTTVFLGGVRVPLVFVSENQINALLPYGVNTKAKYQVIILRAGALSAPETIAVLDAQPAVFTVDQTGKGQGHIYRIPPEGGQFLASASAPVTAGDVLTIYCAGLGEVQPHLDAGVPAPLDMLEYTVNTVTATIGGVGAQVLFSGLTPGFTGLYQVNLLVPTGVARGAGVLVVLNAAGQSSVPVTIGVR